MHKNQLHFDDEIVGKKVARVFSDYDNTWMIVFTDGTFSLFQAFTDDGEPYLENVGFSLRIWKVYAKELLSLGVLSQDEYDKFTAEQDEFAEASRHRRFAEYMKLKREFEPCVDPMTGDIA